MLTRASIASATGRVVPATAGELAALEATLGFALPSELRELLTLADFCVSFEWNYDALDAAGIADEWSSLAKVSRQWLPFAITSGGNKLCIDLAPGPDGTVGQIIAYEVQGERGPDPTDARSLTELLAFQVRLIEEGLFELEGDEGYEFVALDRHFWRLRKR